MKTKQNKTKQNKTKRAKYIALSCFVLITTYFTSCKKEDKFLKHSNENSLSQGFDVIHKEKAISKSLGFSSPMKDSFQAVL